jgi:hypothetical protein
MRHLINVLRLFSFNPESRLRGYATISYLKGNEVIEE